MRDRVKLIVNNREVQKRYLGNRLVWESAKKLWNGYNIAFAKRTTNEYGKNEYRISFTNSQAVMTLRNKTVTKLFLENPSINKNVEIIPTRFEVNETFNDVIFFVKSEDYEKPGNSFTYWNVSIFGN